MTNKMERSLARRNYRLIVGDKNEVDSTSQSQTDAETDFKSVWNHQQYSGYYC